MDFGVQIIYQSHYFGANMKWSHGHYEHFAPAGLFQNHNTSVVFNKSVEIHFVQKSGTHFRDNIRDFDVISAAISMKIQSGLDQHGPGCPENQQIIIFC